jgi:hypothetical protein
MTRSRGRPFLEWTSFVLCGLLFVLHSSLAQLSNRLMSPLKLQLANVVFYYVDAHFKQQGNFFVLKVLLDRTSDFCVY